MSDLNQQEHEEEIATFKDVLSLTEFMLIHRNPARVRLVQMMEQFYGCPLRPTVEQRTNGFVNPYISGFIKYAYVNLFEPNEFFDYDIFSNWKKVKQGYKEKALDMVISKLIPSMFQTPRHRLVAMFNHMFYIQHQDDTFEDLCYDYPRNAIYRLGYCGRHFGDYEFNQSFNLCFASSRYEDCLVIYNEHGSLFELRRTMDWNYLTFLEKFLSIELLQNFDYSLSHVI